MSLQQCWQVWVEEAVVIQEVRRESLNLSLFLVQCISYWSALERYTARRGRQVHRCAHLTEPKIVFQDWVLSIFHKIWLQGMKAFITCSLYFAHKKKKNKTKNNKKNPTTTHKLKKKLFYFYVCPLKKGMQRGNFWCLGLENSFSVVNTKQPPEILKYEAF